MCSFVNICWSILRPQVRDLAIPDREPLRTHGPGWESAFFSYLQGTGCPYDFTPTPGTRAGGGDEEGRTGPSDGSDSNMVLRGLSWLSSEAVAREFEDDNGKDYKGAARRVRVRALSYVPIQSASQPLRWPSVRCDTYVRTKHGTMID